MDSSELTARLGGPRAPLIFDLRRRPAFEADGRLIPGARWRDHLTVADWAAAIRETAEIVVYCVHGHQVSQSAAARQRALGRGVRVLRGGIGAWVAAGGPTLAAEDLPEEAGCYVLDLEPDAGALAAAWLIRRFADPAAEILLVEAVQRTAVAGELAARALGPSDYPDLLARFGLSEAGLQDLPRAIADLWRGQLILAEDAAATLAGGFALLDAAFAARRS